ncbi:hypothetical protein BCR43DRAFT_520023 [Syncephalastrum racemosum]|uniref:BZIP domain-containing protein n=1 Tax=Syncephalastrum racemosum TaxID=13706 RepID=A0A1X2HT67_SYNRA|nr:hypothetical protein BCR43DRAFT_520023 [Syncephalastrum racemosum]
MDDTDTNLDWLLQLPNDDIESFLSRTDAFPMPPAGFSNDSFFMTEYDQQSTTTSSSSSPPSDSQTSATKPAKSTGSSVGLLDFRVKPKHDVLSETQLKQMTSKERRQLRNKISARNFRTRRKEYITTLEEEIDSLKTERSQLKQALDHAHGKIAALQKENDQMRLDLALVQHDKYTLHAPSSNLEDILFSPVPPTPIVSSSSSSLSSNSSTYASSSPSSVSQSLSPGDIFRVDHALIPSWDWSAITEKDKHNSTVFASRETLTRYPLLVPALMSIVLAHTLSMSVKELSLLSPPTQPKLLGPAPLTEIPIDVKNTPIAAEDERPVYPEEELPEETKITKEEKSLEEMEKENQEDKPKQNCTIFNSTVWDILLAWTPPHHQQRESCSLRATRKLQEKVCTIVWSKLASLQECHRQKRYPCPFSYLQRNEERIEQVAQ